MVDDPRPPFRFQFDNARDPYSARNALGIVGAGGTGDAEYIVAVDDPTLSNDRVLTDTVSVTWDFTTAGQAKANTSEAGVTDGSATPAGKVGEVISGSRAFGSAVTMSNNTDTNITSMTLSAGRWEITADLHFNSAGTANNLSLFAYVATASATTNSNDGFRAFTATPAILADWTAKTGPVRVSVSGSTTYYLNGRQANPGATATVIGYGTIRAMRV